jgi:hypothetical protein
MRILVLLPRCKFTAPPTTRAARHRRPIASSSLFTVTSTINSMPLSPWAAEELQMPAAQPKARLTTARKSWARRRHHAKKARSDPLKHVLVAAIPKKTDRPTRATDGMLAHQCETIRAQQVFDLGGADGFGGF